MTRIFAHLIILFVLFTHSTMAMDVHVSLEVNHSAEHSHSLSPADMAIDANQDFCSDAVGHCSYHFAHAAGLVSTSLPSAVEKHPALFPHFQTSVIIHKQAPPHRPPKV